MFAYHFILIFSAILIAVNAASLGSFLVLNKMSMLIDAIAHAILPAIVISFVLFNFDNSVFTIVLSCVVGVLAVIGIHYFSLKIKVSKDAFIGVVYTFLFAVGVVLISFQFKNSPFDIESILFGEISYLPYSKGWWFNGFKVPYITIVLLIFTVLNMFCIIKYKKIWVLLSFDNQMAKTMGVNVLRSTLIFLSLITVNTIVAFQSVGAIMIISLTVVPASFAYIATKNINLFFVFTIVIAVVSVLLGYVLAYFLNVNIIAMVSVLLGFSLFVFLLIQSKLNKSKNKLQKSL